MSERTETTCSEMSAARGEPLAGSASEAALFAAVSWPKPLWHADKVARSEGLPAALAGLEKWARAAGHRLQLRLMQRDGGAETDRLEVVCADFAHGRSAWLRDVPAGDAAELIQAFVTGDAEPGEPLHAPLVLVCTDGRHDRCCGKLGRSLAAALKDAVEVREASHLGGHRLAPNCLVLPSGRLYGRVSPADAPRLLDAVRHDRVYLPCYRGRTGLPELEQVAEAAVLAEVGDGAVALGAPEPAGNETWVPATAGGRHFRVICARQVWTGLGSCADPEPEERSRWVALSVRDATSSL